MILKASAKALRLSTFPTFVSPSEQGVCLGTDAKAGANPLKAGFANKMFGECSPFTVILIYLIHPYTGFGRRCT